MQRRRRAHISSSAEVHQGTEEAALHTVARASATSGGTSGAMLRAMTADAIDLESIHKDGAVIFPWERND